MKPIAIFCCIAFVLTASPVQGQENHLQEHHTADSGKHAFKPSHSLGVAIGHSHVFNGRDEEGKRKTLTLPMWGLDYNYQFASHWQIGLHTDFIVETFEVEKHLEGGGSNEVVERSTPIAPALMAFYKSSHHWGFGLGAGGEFAKEENYFLNRAAVEYGAEISERWEVFGVVQYDFRWKAYDTWSVGIGISKVLGKGAKRHHE